MYLRVNSFVNRQFIYLAMHQDLTFSTCHSRSNNLHYSLNNNEFVFDLKLQFLKNNLNLEPENCILKDISYFSSYKT